MTAPPSFLLTKYDDVELIGEGGFGRVYKCTHAEITTAVKILVALDSESQARFQREVDLLQRVDHENIVKVVDAGETDGFYWYESEYANEGHFGSGYGYAYSDLDRVNYFRQICLGVQALHELTPPIIHRDLKPRNILVFRDPEQEAVLKIADFGLVAIAGDAHSFTVTGKVLGSADYIAPERLKNPRIKTPESDIYSLGIAFLEAYTGRTRPSQENLYLVPSVIRHVIEKMVREYPRDRYQKVAEVIESLDELPFDLLFYGRVRGANEEVVFTAHANIHREIENATEALYASNSDNVIERLAELERKLDCLGDACGAGADAIMRVTGNVLGVIDGADRNALLGLVQRFFSAVDNMAERDEVSPVPDMWSHFLADAFQFSSHPETKHLCLEGLAKFLVQFGSPGTKNYLYFTIIRIDGDPFYMQYLAEQLRKVGREDIAVLLDGVPDQHPLNLEAISAALRGPV